MSELPSAFTAAIEESLPGNERLLATAAVYDDRGHHSLVLTGTSLRVVDFATKPRFRLHPYIVVPLAFGGWVVWMMVALGHLVPALVAIVITLIVCRMVGTVGVAVPTVAATTTVPISATTAAGVRSYVPKGAYRAVTEMAVSYAGGGMAFRTTDSGPLRALFANLEAIRAGRSVTASTATTADALTRLAKLLDDGAITQAEFEAAKAGMINVEPAVGNSRIAELRSLYDLHRAGGLSGGEWRQAKWDLLTINGRTGS